MGSPTPLEQWQERYAAAMAAWLKANPRPDRIEDRRAHRLAKDEYRQVWLQGNPPPPQTKDEREQGKRLQKLNRLLGGG